MLCVCAISANQLNSGHIGVKEGIRTPLVKRAILRRMNLGDMKQHKISLQCHACVGSKRADYTVNGMNGQMGDFFHGQPETTGFQDNVGRLDVTLRVTHSHTF